MKTVNVTLVLTSLALAASAGSAPSATRSNEIHYTMDRHDAAATATAFRYRGGRHRLSATLPYKTQAAAMTASAVGSGETGGADGAEVDGHGGNEGKWGLAIE